MVLGQMDMQSYLDYFCANMYLSNADYGEDDSAIWRTIQTGSGYSDGKWRWLIGKTDNTVDNATASKLTTSSLNSYLQKSVTSDAFFQSLLKNEQFRQQLYTTMKRMAEQTFSTEQVNANIDIVSKQMQKLAVCNYKRFVLYPSDTFYSDEIKKIEVFFTKRGDYIMRYTKEVAKIN
jgi:hypothetical protein